MLSKPEFPLILFCVVGALLTWPLMELHRQFSPLGRLGYFFMIWAAVVCLYGLLSRRLN